MWAWFRRLFLGTVIEGLLAESIGVDFGSIDLQFDDDSHFQVPHINNYMRFKGKMTAVVTTQPDAASIARIRALLLEAWPSLVSVVDIPVGDRLTVEKNEMSVRVDGSSLSVSFDLEAD
jgi:hypothetical protein